MITQIEMGRGISSKHVVLKTFGTYPTKGSVQKGVDSEVISNVVRSTGDDECLAAISKLGVNSSKGMLKSDELCNRDLGAFCTFYVDVEAAISQSSHRRRRTRY